MQMDANHCVLVSPLCYQFRRQHATISCPILFLTGGSVVFFPTSKNAGHAIILRLSIYEEVAIAFRLT